MIIEYKIFDWNECAITKGAYTAGFFRELCNERIDIDEFVFQYTTIKHEHGRPCPPNEAKRNYKYLKEKFGFFIGKKII